MADYDFSCLSSYEFEILIKDLFYAETGLVIEIFTQGRDSGIDLRCLKHNQLIIQCKNYAKTPYRTLLSHLKKYERPKIESLKPDQYILTTSVGLTPKNKTEIMEIFKPFCLSDSDIWGKDDIITRLDINPEIVKKNYKLWLISTIILEELFEKVVCRDILIKTKVDFDNFSETLPKLVVTESFNYAYQKLQENNVCVLFGLPGSGKSTLMKFLVLNYCQRKFEPIYITNNIVEAHRLYKEDVNQIFYYDDFLGKCFLSEDFNDNEDTLLIDLINKIKRTKNKKFILSTREYIFNQARTKSHKIEEIELYKYSIKLSSLTKSEKAKILYNHIWHSDIEYEKVEEILNDKNYFKIIEHSNFNPRLIESMINIAKNTNHFLISFLETLDHPKDLWQHPFENDISHESRILLYLLGSFTNGCSSNKLLKIFSYFFSDCNDGESIKNHEIYYNSLKELEGTFIRIWRHVYNNDYDIDFHNPSIHDYIYERLFNNIHIISNVVKKSISLIQLYNIFEYIQKISNSKRSLTIL